MAKSKNKALQITNDTEFPAGKYEVYISGVNRGKNITTNINNLGTFFNDSFLIRIENKTTEQKWEFKCKYINREEDFLVLSDDLKVKIRKEVGDEIKTAGVKAYIETSEYDCVFLGEAEFPEGFAFSDLSCEYSNKRYGSCGNFEVHHKNADESEIALDIGIYDSKMDGFSNKLYIDGKEVDFDDSEYDIDEIFEHLEEIDENDSVLNVYKKLGFTLFKINYPDDKEMVDKAGKIRPERIESVVIADGVTEIEATAFYGCSSLSQIAIPDSVTEIGERAFYNCSSLTQIAIPDSVTKIGENAFRGCSSLTQIAIPDGVTKIGADAFSGCRIDSLSHPCVEIKNGLAFSDKALLYVANYTVTDIAIPDGVTKIGKSAFSGCTSLASITIPVTVTKIEGYAFSDCESLTSIAIPDGVTEIGAGAFAGCTSLASINIPDTVTRIESSVFKDCTSLTSITIPESVKKIEESAFSGCSSLTQITIPASVREIGESAFNGCLSLTSITIPACVTKIGAGKYGGWTFASCKSLTSIVIPNSVSEIEQYAFHHCTSLSSVQIPDGVTQIGRCAFYNCESLTSIKIPYSIKRIEEKAFNYCTSLSEVSFGGTMAQWASVKRMKYWNSRVPAKTVKCTDGETSIDAEKPAKKAGEADSGLQWLF